MEKVKHPSNCNKIVIENFKGFKGKYEFEIRPLTILVGPNNSGKSTVSKAIEFLTFIAEKKFSSNFELFYYDFDKPEFTERFGNIENLMHHGESNFAVGYLDEGFEYDSFYFIQGNAMDGYYDDYTTMASNIIGITFNFIKNENYHAISLINKKGIILNNVVIKVKYNVGEELYTTDVIINRDNRIINESFLPLMEISKNYNVTDPIIKPLLDKINIHNQTELENYIFSIYKYTISKPLSYLYGIKLEKDHENGSIYKPEIIENLPLSCGEQLLYSNFIVQHDDSSQSLYPRYQINFSDAEYTFDELILLLIEQSICKFATLNKMENRDVIRYITKHDTDKLKGIENCIGDICKHYSPKLEFKYFNTLLQIVIFRLHQYKFLGGGMRIAEETEEVFNKKKHDEISKIPQFRINEFNSILKIKESKGINHYEIKNSCLEILNRFVSISNARSVNLAGYKYFDSNVKNSFVEAIRAYENISFFPVTNPTIRKYLQHFNLGDDFKINRLEGTSIYTLSLIKNGIETKHTDLGSGVVQLFQVILHIVLYDSTNWGSNSNGSLILDEPEINMHPALQSELGWLFYTVFNTKFNSIYRNTKCLGVKIDNSLIIETHSEYIIRKIQLMRAQDKNASDLYTEMGDNIIIHYLGNPEDKERTFPIEITPSGQLTRAFGPGFFDEATNLGLLLFDYSNN